MVWCVENFRGFITPNLTLKHHVNVRRVESIQNYWQLVSIVMGVHWNLFYNVVNFIVMLVIHSDASRIAWRRIFVSYRFVSFCIVLYRFGGAFGIQIKNTNVKDNHAEIKRNETKRNDENFLVALNVIDSVENRDAHTYIFSIIISHFDRTIECFIY